MTFFKRSRRQYAVAGVVFLFLIPIAMAAFVPFLAPISTQEPGWAAPSLPEREEPLPDFQYLLDSLPLIVRDLPDAESQEVVAAYDAAILTDHLTALDLLDAAKLAVPVPANLSGEWMIWLDEMMDIDSWDEPAPIPNLILTALEGDSRNGDRLSNLAVAMFFAQVTTPIGEGNPSGRLAGSPVQARVIMLLQSLRAAFPESRSATLNFVAILQLFAAANPILTDVEQSDYVLNQWLTSHPDDATAILLLVRLHKGNLDSDPTIATISNYLVPLSQSMDAPRAALGHALLGDLIMLDAPGGPYAARLEILQALREYDKALELSDDPSLYAARSMALERLGDIRSAIDAQERALDFAPQSVTVRIRLAQLYLELRGNETDILAAVQTARALSQEGVSLVGDQDGMPLKEIELRLIDGTNLNGYTLHRPERYFFILGPLPGGAGGATVSFDSIPIFQELPLPIQPTDLRLKSPIIWAVGYAVLSSVILGDPDSAADDLDKLLFAKSSSLWFFDTVPEWATAAWNASRLIAGRDNPANDGLDYLSVNIAIDALRYAGLPQRAVAICTSALNGPDYQSKDISMLRTCIAENAYLSGDYETSKQSFDSLGNDLMVGYVAERQGDRHEAETKYRQAIAANNPDSYLAMVRLADMTLEEHSADAIKFYDQVIEWAIMPGGCIEGCTPVKEKLPQIYSNRGVAQLQLLADNSGRIDCSGGAWEACTAAFLDFDAALEFDAYNPVFLMNKAWVSRLLGDQGLSAQLMDQADDADTTLYPVLNDLGVFAAMSGDSKLAKQHFLEAVAVNPHYDLALWNLGVLNMQDGIRGVFRGQAYLARAILQNPSLVTDSMDFLTDERVYRVEINQQLRPGSSWTFGAASSIAATAFGFVTVVLMIPLITYEVGLSKLQDKMMSRLDSSSKWILQHLPPTLNRQPATWLPMTITLSMLAVTTAWVARNGEPNAAAAAIALAFFAVVLAVVAHEAGHAMVARRMHVSVQSAQWVPGTVLALLMLPFVPVSGPYPSQKIVANNQRASSCVAVAGPLANMAVAIAAYIVFLLQPMPLLRIIAQVQLVAMGYALLPFMPLDGAVLTHTHPRLLGLLGGAVLLVSILFTWGIL